MLTNVQPSKEKIYFVTHIQRIFNPYGHRGNYSAYGL